MTPSTRPAPFQGIPLFRPALDRQAAAVLRRQTAALNDDFGPDGWRVWLSDDPAGRLYAVWRQAPGRTEDAADARLMRETIAGRMARHLTSIGA